MAFKKKSALTRNVIIIFQMLYLKVWPCDVQICMIIDEQKASGA